MLHVLRPYRVAVERLAIALSFTLIIADLYPHPRLSPGLLLTTTYRLQSEKSRIQSVNTAVPEGPASVTASQ